MSPTKEAHQKLFGKESGTKEDWEVAREVIDHFDVPKLGEELAKKVIFDIVNHVHFPTKEMTMEMVGRAEGLATELFEEFKDRDEPHMSELEYLERKKLR